MNYFPHKFFKLFVHQLVPITLIISLIVIVIVLIAEFYFSLLPCELCVYQRFPYIAVIVFAALAIGSGFYDKQKIALLFASIFLVSSFLAFYHSGVEYGLWSYGGCAKQALPDTLEKFHSSLAHPMPKSCNEIEWTIFNLSISIYNGVLSLALSIISLYSAVRLKK
ncbi:MAG: Disulfide bond formation protein B [Alphaproteobacteria bacterium MarineAlpha3_Bin7]|nr:MAG: Disulfide bond formation protein B [Alphaproteobacteria bacterium MarineAlpha3_Bin7]|tara:strand:- start:807 stop:1304 length:498 start_codon:yes stop_codon:yes gene_type:complete